MTAIGIMALGLSSWMSFPLQRRNLRFLTLGLGSSKIEIIIGLLREKY